MISFFNAIHDSRMVDKSRHYFMKLLQQDRHTKVKPFPVRTSLPPKLEHGNNGGLVGGGRGLSMLAAAQPANDQFMSVVMASSLANLMQPAKPSPLFVDENDAANSLPPLPLSLQHLVHTIERDIQLHRGPITTDKKAQVLHALQSFDAPLLDLLPYVHFDKTKLYTRNLVATDFTSYALMVLCWNKGQYSPIHDHPCDGCWVRHIQGTLHEVRYRHTGTTLDEISNAMITQGVSYMDDSLGLHKIGNPSREVDAIT
ncbi:hypothetical protein As57867_003379, partial [Aphanomyces stellatus]